MRIGRSEVHLEDGQASLSQLVPTPDLPLAASVTSFFEGKPSFSPGTSPSPGNLLVE